MTSSFRDALSWAQTRNPAPCTALDSGLARPATIDFVNARPGMTASGWMRGSSPRMTQQDFWISRAGMLVAGLNVSELLELAGLLVVVGALAGFLAGVFGIGG